MKSADCFDTTKVERWRLTASILGILIEELIIWGTENSGAVGKAANPGGSSSRTLMVFIHIPVMQMGDLQIKTGPALGSCGEIPHKFVRNIFLALRMSTTIWEGEFEGKI